MYKKIKDRFKIKIAKHVKKIVLKIRKCLFMYITCLFVYTTCLKRDSYIFSKYDITCNMISIIN